MLFTYFYIKYSLCCKVPDLASNIIHFDNFVQTCTNTFSYLYIMEIRPILLGKYYFMTLTGQFRVAVSSDEPVKQIYYKAPFLF